MNEAIYSEVSTYMIRVTNWHTEVFTQCLRRYSIDHVHHRYCKLKQKEVIHMLSHFNSYQTGISYVKNPNGNITRL